MKPSHKLVRAIDALEDNLRRVIGERQAPIRAQIALLQGLKFETLNEASRLTAEAMTSPDPAALLIQAAEQLQRQDVLDTAASLRASVVATLTSKLATFEEGLKGLYRLRTLATASVEQATKATMARTVGGASDYASTSVERHLAAGVQAAQGVVESLRVSFPQSDVSKRLGDVAEAFTALLESVQACNGV